MMVYCSQCGMENSDENKFCIGCGAELPEVKVLARARTEEKPIVEGETAEKWPKGRFKKGKYVPIVQKKSGGKGKWVAAIIILAVLGFLGYRYFTDTAALDSLQTSVSGAGALSIGITSVSIPLILTIENPSGNESPPFTLSYDVFISGTKVVSGSASVPSISGSSSRDTSFTVSISYTSVGSAIVDIISSGSFSLTINGHLEAKTAFGLIPISKSFSSYYTI